MRSREQNSTMSSTLVDQPCKSLHLEWQLGSLPPWAPLPMTRSFARTKSCWASLALAVCWWQFRTFWRRNDDPVSNYPKAPSGGMSDSFSFGQLQRMSSDSSSAYCTCLLTLCFKRVSQRSIPLLISSIRDVVHHHRSLAKRVCPYLVLSDNQGHQLLPCHSQPNDSRGGFRRRVGEPVHLPPSTQVSLFEQGRSDLGRFHDAPTVSHPQERQ